MDPGPDEGDVLLNDLTSRIEQARAVIASSAREGAQAAPPTAYSALSGLLYDRYQHQGSYEDVREACELDERALALTRLDDPELPERKCCLAVDLEALSRIGYDDGLLDRALDLICQAIADTPPGPENRVEWRERKYNLAVYRSRQYKISGDIDALRDSHEVLEEVVRDYGAQGPVDTDCLHMLGEVYHDLHTALGDMDALEKAVDLFGLCLSQEPDQDFRRCRVEEARARALHDLYAVTGDRNHLDAAVTHMRSAMAFIPSGSVLVPDYQSHLAAFLESQYSHSNDTERLKETVRLERASLNSTRNDSPFFALRHANLGHSLELLYGVEADDAILSESIDMQRAALEVSSGHPWLDWWRTKLSQTYLTRYAKLGVRDDLESAVHFAELGCQHCSPKQPDFAPAHLAHARALIQLEREGGQAEKLTQKIIGCLTQAYEASFIPNIKMDCALQYAWYEEENENYEEALKGYCDALELLPQLFWLGMEVMDRAVLSNRLKLASMTSDAAACALQVGDIQLGLEILEQGRSLLWSQTLSLQADISDLRLAHPTEASHFETLSNQIRQRIAVGDVKHTTQQGARQGIHSHAAGDSSLLARRSMNEWMVLVAKIRSFKGFENFLKPLKFESFKGASRNGPVVVLSSSWLRADAIILSIKGTVSTIPLPRLDHGELESHAWDASKGRGKDRPLLRGRASSDLEESSAAAESTVNWLWNSIATHLLDSLSKMDLLDSRVWLCPTGFFTFLPIHAARPSDDSLPGLADLFVLSYTSTMSALQRAIELSEAESGCGSSAPFRLLLVGQSASTEEGYEALDTTGEELRRIRRYVPHTSVTELEEKDATVARVTEAIPHHPWVHFCCHGHQDLDPMLSSLHLSDGLLRMRQLMSLEMHEAEFAFLSACETATGDRRLPDEAMHLAAGLQFAGFTSIISTLWSIDDNVAPRVAEAVYKRLCGSRTEQPRARNAARALTDAIRECRSKGVSQARLIPFVHIGL